MANRHLIEKLLATLGELDFLLLRRKKISREVQGKVVECIAWFDGDHTVHFAVKGHTSAEELIHSGIHETCHAAGYNEDVVDGGLDNAAYTSRSLREAIAKKFMETSLRL